MASNLHIPEERAQAVIERFTDGGESSMFPPGFIFDCLATAVQACGSDRAFEVFEQEDPEDLMRRGIMFHALNNPTIPLHTTPELIAIVQCLIAYLDTNRNWLIENGLPRYGIPQSAFFDDVFGRNYFVKMPVAVQDGRSPNAQRQAEKTGHAEIENSNLVYSYSWAKTALEDDSVHLAVFINGKEIWMPNVGWTNAGGLLAGVEICDYNDASYLPDIEQHAQLLEIVRPKLHSVKESILHHVRDALLCQDAGTLGMDCISIIKDEFLKDEVEKLYEIDFEYSQLVNTILRKESHSGYCSLGGFTHLIEMIQYFNFVVANGTVSDIRSQLDSLPSHLPFSSRLGYFTLLDKAWRSDLDRAIDMQYDLQESFHTSRAQFYEFLTHEEDYEFRAQIDFDISGFAPSREHESISNDMRALFEQRLQGVQPLSESVTPSISLHDNIFRLKAGEEYFEIRFQGQPVDEPVQLLKSEGLWRIHMLLSKGSATPRTLYCASGRDRDHDKKIKQVRDANGGSIKEARKKICKAGLPDLADYLRNTIKNPGGLSPRYEPRELSIDWKLE
jgi:hypothetical protein